MARDPLLQAALLAALGLLPIVFVTTTSFARFAIILAGLRLALGTQNLPPNSVTFSLALVLSLAVMEPIARQMHHEFTATTGDTALDELQLDGLARAATAAAGPWLAFLELNSGDRERDAIRELRSRRPRSTAPHTSGHGAPPPDTHNGADERTAADGERSSEHRSCDEHRDDEDRNGEHRACDEPPINDHHTTSSVAAPSPTADDAITHAAAFALTELNRAFELIFLLFLPFVLIDLIAGAVLMSLGMHMLSPAAVSLPFKLLLFVGTDGWSTLTAQLLDSYVYPPAL